MPLRDEIMRFLDTTLSGSTLRDGYFHVLIKAPNVRRVKHDQYQRVLDRICGERCWMICVGTDPTASVRASRVEKETILYTPDWNMSEPMTEWLLELDHANVDLDDVATGMPLNSALVFIDPNQRVAFHVNFGRVYASTAEDLARFADGIETSLEPDA